MGPSVGLLLESIPDSPEDIASSDEPPSPPPPPTSAADTPSTTQLTLGRRKALLKQLLLGLDYLHSGAVVHGDLNPGNFPVGNPTILEPRHTEYSYSEPFRGPGFEKAFEESRPDGMEASECANVLSLLRSLMQYQPDMRPSTAKLLDDEWFLTIDS